MLRLDTYGFNTSYVPGLLAYTMVGLLLRLSIFYSLDLYSRYWRYASIEEIIQIVLAVFYSSTILAFLFFTVRFFHDPVQSFRLPEAMTALPRSIPFIESLLILIGVGGTRFSVRLASQWRWQWTELPETLNVLIVGAGQAGTMIVREMQNKPRLGMEPIGYVDDDVQKQGMRIHGIPVLGSRQEIPRILKLYKVDQVIIAMPTASGKVIREIVQDCERLGTETKIIPGMYELLDGTASVKQLRDVDIEDLLRRRPVQTNITAVRTLIKGKRVLITGGGGSIGSELCRQVLRCQPAQIVIVGHGENSVFQIFHELRGLEGADKKGKESCISVVIADVRFPERLQAIFSEHKPEIVFHAAAHKHVPLMEMNPAEAITNNVLGTRNLLDVSLAHNVERFVMISTDKAVNPTSIMGASKRTAELLVHQAAARSGRPYVAVRFGNVLGSRGSVVLTFKRQIAAGGPVTVTHPEMTRYFMTIPEAVQLVLQAATIGRGREVFVLDMGKPVKILDLARDLIQLSGLEVDRDIDIAFIGMRPGEKMYEELFVPGEAYKRTAHEKIFIAINASQLAPHRLDQAIDVLEAAAQRNDGAGIVLALKNLIPEFKPVEMIEKPAPQAPLTIANGALKVDTAVSPQTG